METMRHNGWMWYDVMHDLEKAGLEGVIINPLTVDPSGFCAGEIGGERFCLSWGKDMFLMVSMLKDNGVFERVRNAFSKVVEYNPFCRYQEESGLITYEWDKRDPDGRYAELEREEKINLERIEN